MSLRYRLPCEKCGRVHPVETGQAGGVMFCDCGVKIRIPTMLKIKRLEPWDEGETAEEKKDDADSTKAPVADAAAAPGASTDSEAQPSASSADKPEESEKGRPRLSAKRRGLFIVASVFFVVSTFFACGAIKTPPPLSVFYKHIDYKLNDGRRIRRDTTPVTREDFDFYFFTDYSDPNQRVYLVDDELIDRMNPFVCVKYFENVKQLEMSDNFYDNYEAVKTRRLLYLVGFGFLSLASLVVALYALFAKESQKQVGTMRGSDWR